MPYALHLRLNKHVKITYGGTYSCFVTGHASTLNLEWARTFAGNTIEHICIGMKPRKDWSVRVTAVAGLSAVYMPLCDLILEIARCDVAAQLGDRLPIGWSGATKDFTVIAELLTPAVTRTGSVTCAPPAHGQLQQAIMPAASPARSSCLPPVTETAHAEALRLASYIGKICRKCVHMQEYTQR
jgi:hypothetical protein